MRSRCSRIGRPGCSCACRTRPTSNSSCRCGVRARIEPALLAGQEEHQRRRDGFAPHRPRAWRRAKCCSEIDYCIYLPRAREGLLLARACTTKDRPHFKKNPLGIPLDGCPLDEQISEMHLLQARGRRASPRWRWSCIDNPMCPGTGHRICNDCMKACIFQKQEPVNIPQIETRVLDRRAARCPGASRSTACSRAGTRSTSRGRYPLPYNGKNVLVVGMGPAGYTLAHHLLNEGFGVVGIDGLKSSRCRCALREPSGACRSRSRTSTASPAARRAHPRRLRRRLRVRHHRALGQELPRRAATCTLARRKNFQLYGGVRFGGTLTLDDAWDARLRPRRASPPARASPPSSAMKNNLIRGIRKASDFLMALQLTGAFKRTRSPTCRCGCRRVVIGGGLTAIDTATELLAYYPVQVEKMLERYETLCADSRRGGGLRACCDAEERDASSRPAGARPRGARRARARGRGRRAQPDFIRLVRAWGGVTIAYRKRAAATRRPTASTTRR